ncbi:hypothetical protein TREPR_3588 [Treponema primitia ZAS-2]|uniref:Uncharacterized protein n=1 Tax=Treponema primitia (strain ATCC BAA-887 / DSM 12427 / ZAS-2) TaxID=545694 RepID=F5YR31_TREPZ|nr:hypothetical protein TREPR_3588 [Treponema primitia ZAS-2]
MVPVLSLWGKKKARASMREGTGFLPGVRKELFGLPGT